MLNFVFDKQTGLTLLELLVVISIIILISAGLLLSSDSHKGALSLQKSAVQLAQHLREAQEMAMGAVAVGCGASETRTFGIYFEQASNNKYWLFADCSNPLNYRRDIGVDVDIKEISFEQGVSIGKLVRPDDLTKTTSATNIVFSPPDPAVDIKYRYGSWRSTLWG